MQIMYITLDKAKWPAFISPAVTHFSLPFSYRQKNLNFYLH